MSNQINWNPIYIRTVLADKPKYRIDSDYWNALWNSAIEQGDNNAEGVLLLKTEVEVLIEQFAEMLDTGTGIVAVATQQANLAQGHQVKSETAAFDSENSAVASQSWAVGGTGSRAGEDTDNAKYYSEQIAIVAEDVEASRQNLLNTIVNEKAEIYQIISDAELGISESVAEVSDAKNDAENAKASAQAAQVAAEKAKAAAEKARDEAQAAVGGDFVTNEDFEEGIKNFVTTSSMEAYVDSVMKVDDSTEV